MTPASPSFTMGIEEEYLLVDAESGVLARDVPETLISDCVDELGDQVTTEFLRAQVEIGTRVCRRVGEAREELKRLRGGVARIAARYSLAPIACSTHPFGDWREQDYTHKERYEGLARDHQAVARRLLICGMHVHIGIEDEETRIDLLNQAKYFLPHLLCLTTSSPFWLGRDTGLNSYRLTVFDSLPRTGLPDRLQSWSEYERLVRHMTSSGLLEDGTKIWWDLRPSARYPTLEMRICDVCPDFEDALSVAALFQCILRMLFRLRLSNQSWREYPNILIEETGGWRSASAREANWWISESASSSPMRNSSTNFSNWCARMPRRSTASRRSNAPVALQLAEPRRTARDRYSGKRVERRRPTGP